MSLKNIAEACDELPEGTYDEYFIFQFELIQSLYNNFKFEAYQERMKMVCSAFDFEFQSKYGCELKKQVEIRNSFQHRDGMMDKKSYQSIGCKVYILQEDGTNKEVKEWEKIELTLAEVKKFLDVLDDFCEDFRIAIENKFNASR